MKHPASKTFESNEPQWVFLCLAKSGCQLYRAVHSIDPTLHAHRILNLSLQKLYD
jgi:hypothetical protein